MDVTQGSWIMAMMNSFERLQAAVEGGLPDKIPACVWFHFGSEHLPPAEVARIHEAYYLAYRWDFLKVMFDYRLDLPIHFDERSRPDISTPLSRFNWSDPFQKQEICLGLLKNNIGNQVPIFTTVYSPWMYILRHAGYDHKNDLLANIDMVDSILSSIADATCHHIDNIKNIGINGIYFATTAGSKGTGSMELTCPPETPSL